MEAHKERAEQVKREEAERNITGRSSDMDDAGIPKVVLAGDKAYEDVIRKAVAGEEDTHGKVAKNPEDVLVFSRSVDKTDSSLQ